jgi:chromate transporter
VTDDEGDPTGRPTASLGVIAREWTRLGCLGFGGPPTHIAMLRRMCVDERRWIPAQEFEDGIAATNLLPGPASTQLAIFCAWRLRRTAGAIVGGVCFIPPGLVLILALSAVFLSHHPPTWILGAAAGAGAAVPAVALNAASGFVPASRERIGTSKGDRARWLCYAVCGGVAAAVAGPYLALVLVGCGLTEIVIRRSRRPRPRPPTPTLPVVGTAGHAAAIGGLAALCWTAFKVGALSYGGGFVIVPLMQHDAVAAYHWMTGTQFLSAVALGQVTPGPVVLTVAVVGYAARGVRGGLLAAVVAFTPSFLFVILGAPRFDRIRANPAIRSFLNGAGPAAIGAIAGSAVPLGLAFARLWQVPVLAAALILLFAARRNVVSVLLLAAGAGAVLALAGVAP